MTKSMTENAATDRKYSRRGALGVLYQKEMSDHIKGKRFLIILLLAIFIILKKVIISIFVLIVTLYVLQMIKRCIF